jgi:hypothetical protein
MVAIKDSTMIACVTLETSKIVDPIDYYGSNRIYLIHYVREATDAEQNAANPKQARLPVGGKIVEENPNMIYQKFYDQVCSLIKEKHKNVEIVEQVAKVTDFNIVLATVINIIEKERSEDSNRSIYVNISAGANEYSAAATMAAFMHDYVVPFSVTTPPDGYMVPLKDYLEPNTGKPIGISKKTFPQEPKREIHNIKIDKPNKRLVRALRIFDEMCGGEKQDSYVKSGPMIKRLKEKGLWERDFKTLILGDNDEIVSDLPKNPKIEAIYYKRDFIDKWLSEGWVKEDKKSKRFLVTDIGRVIISIYYPETDPDADKQPQ